MLTQTKCCPACNLYDPVGRNGRSAGPVLTAKVPSTMGVVRRNGLDGHIGEVTDPGLMISVVCTLGTICVKVEIVTGGATLTLTACCAAKLPANHLNHQEKSQGLGYRPRMHVFVHPPAGLFDKSLRKVHGTAQNCLRLPDGRLLREPGPDGSNLRGGRRSFDQRAGQHAISAVEPSQSLSAAKLRCVPPDRPPSSALRPRRNRRRRSLWWCGY